MWLLSFSANKLKEGLSKCVDKVKPKKAKKMERRVFAPNEDEVDGRECSLHSPHDSDRVRLLHLTSN